MLYLSLDVGVRKDEKGTWSDQLIIAMAAPATVNVKPRLLLNHWKNFREGLDEGVEALSQETCQYSSPILSAGCA